MFLKLKKLLIEILIEEQKPVVMGETEDEFENREEL